MNIREEQEERNKSSKTAAAVGITAVIGVGVGAALYYFFNRNNENPGSHSSTSAWEAEHNLTSSHKMEDSSSSDSDTYSTVSEHTTTDTSIMETEFEIDSDTSDSTESSSDSSDESQYQMSCDNCSQSSFSEQVRGIRSRLIQNMSYDSFNIDDEWEMYDLDSIMSENNHSFSQSGNATDNKRKSFRQRSYSLEQCSICFDVMLKDEELMALPCTHNFHTKCILPWIEQRQTCPVCRKPAE